MKSFVVKLCGDRRGQALPLVLAALAFGALLIAPSLSYVSTSLKAANTVKENVRGLYAAEAGIEDGMWRLRYDPPAESPYSYTLSSLVNGMTVNVVIQHVEMFNGIETGELGPHADFLHMDKELEFVGMGDDGSAIYHYTLTMTNMEEGEIMVQSIMLELPGEFTYLGPTSSDLTSADPDESGDIFTVLTWEFPAPYPKIGKSDPKIGVYTTAILEFDLTTPEELTGDLEDKEGFGVVNIRRSDIDYVADMLPSKVTAVATDGRGAVQGKVEAGVYIGGGIWVRHWQINP